MSDSADPELPLEGVARGCFITMEGGEGAGKSTQIKLLADGLRRTLKGPELIVTREPGGSAGAEQIRRLLVTGEPGRWSPVAETILHFSARRDHCDRTIWPALERGDWVVSDRFADSTRAYQGYGLGVSSETIEALYAACIGSFGPDLTLILDIDPEIGVQRARGRLQLFDMDEDRYERMDLGFHQRLRDGFRAIAAAHPDRCLLIDATASVEVVQAEIRGAVKDRLGIALPRKIPA